MKCKLSDVCNFVTGERIKVSSLSNKTYISAENMLPDRGGVTLSASLPTENETQQYEIGDVLVSNIRIYFKKIWQANCKGGCSNDVLVFRAKENIDTGFLYYVLSSDAFFKYATATQKSGTKMPRGSKAAIMDYQFYLPPIETQRKITSALSPLDGKIRLNRTTNETLREQLKLLYDYWFTQFDFPDENGNPYRASGGKLTWNKGIEKDIPASWRVDRLANISLLELGGTPDTTNPSYWYGDVNWLNSGEVAQFPVVSSELTITKDGLKNSATKLMKAGTVVVSITGNIRASILAIDTCANQSVVGIKENSLLQSPYVYPAMVNFLDYYERISTGNCQRHINKETLEDTLIVLPPQKILDSYYAVATPLCKLLIDNAMESHKLSKLRDWLLPMLMNGQVTVA